jgi:putative hydrolase of the HAD superfamily
MAIRAVVFDYGQVLCTQEPTAHRRLCEITGLDAAAFDRLYWRDRHGYDLGLFDGRGYWARFAHDAGLHFTPSQIEALLKNDVLMWTSINKPMLAWATALQGAGLLTAILSNMVGEVLRSMRQEFAWLANFSQLTWSCELGIAKPDPAIYSFTCTELGIEPQEAVFIDDNATNIRAAQEFGIHAIQFSNIEQLRQELAVRSLLQDLPRPGEDVSTPA